MERNPGSKTLTGETMLDFEIFPHTSTTPISGISLPWGVVAKWTISAIRKIIPFRMAAGAAGRSSNRGSTSNRSWS